MEAPTDVTPLVLLSGGMDSATALYWARQRYGTAKAISFSYGQRHSRELQAAQLITTGLGVEHHLNALMGPLASDDCALTNYDLKVPEGHYADESMRATVVPYRNLVLLVHSALRALKLGCNALVYGAHAGDHAIYPDCRPTFAMAVRNALELGHYDPVRLITPFIEDTKADIVRNGDRLGVPFELTWSCYNGGEFHCGRCGTCVERREAFIMADIPDPTTYATEYEPVADPRVS